MSFLFSCKKGENAIVDNRGYEYAPVNEGLVREYLVTSTDRFGSTKVTSTYYLKEVIGKSFDSGDQSLTELWRYKKSNVTDSYVFDSLWSFSVRDDYVVLSENFKKRIEFAFPVYNDLIFDENTFNSSSGFNLFQRSGYAKIVNGVPFTDCVITYRNDLSNLIETVNQEHYFAKNIGLVYSSRTNLSHQPDADTIGSYYVKELISVSN